MYMCVLIDSLIYCFIDNIIKCIVWSRISKTKKKLIENDNKLYIIEFYWNCEILNLNWFVYVCICVLSWLVNPMAWECQIPWLGTVKSHGLGLINPMAWDFKSHSLGMGNSIVIWGFPAGICNPIGWDCQIP